MTAIGVPPPTHASGGYNSAKRRHALSAAQICNLLVSPNLTASRDDFSDTTGARRLRRFSVQNLQAPFLFHRLWNFVRGSGVNAALLWLRQHRAALYRGVAFCGTSVNARALELSDALPITNRRNGRLQICATRPRCARNTSNRRVAADALHSDSALHFCRIFHLFAVVLALSPFLQAANFEVVTNDGIAFIQIPAGTFTMGTSEAQRASLAEQKAWSRFENCELPAHTVTITRSPVKPGMRI